MCEKNSERELLKLCHINRGGPVFLRHSVYAYMLAEM